MRSKLKVGRDFMKTKMNNFEAIPFETWYLIKGTLNGFFAEDKPLLDQIRGKIREIEKGPEGINITVELDKDYKALFKVKFAIKKDLDAETSGLEGLLKILKTN